MNAQHEKIQEALAAVRRQFSGSVAVGIILGTGLGELADQIETESVVDYRDIPHFPRSTALSHKGRLVIGRLAGVDVVAMQGRCHLYEGYSAADVGLPVQVMRELGAETLIVSNASGGINPKHNSGDILVMEDHLDMMFDTSLSFGGTPDHIRRNDATLIPYCPNLIRTALEVARRENFAAHPGVYISVTGPVYETRAEYRMYRKLGGDAVGMSTVPEVMVAAQCGMRILALSMITNIARPDAPEVVDPEEVVEIAGRCEPNLRKIVLEVIQGLGR